MVDGVVLTFGTFLSLHVVGSGGWVSSGPHGRTFQAYQYSGRWISGKTCVSNWMCCVYVRTVCSLYIRIAQLLLICMYTCILYSETWFAHGITTYVSLIRLHFIMFTDYIFQAEDQQLAQSLHI